MEEITLIFDCSSIKRKSCVPIFKVPQGADEWDTNWRKDIEGGNHKTYLRL